MPDAAPPIVPRRRDDNLIFKALYDRKGENSDELSFAEGDILSVIDKGVDDGWVKCRLRDSEGLVPFNYSKYLLEIGDVSIVEEYTEKLINPLHEAAKRANLEMLLELVALKVDINGKDAIGNSPLHYSCRFGYEEVVRAILDLKPKFYQNNVGETPLHAAAWGGHPKIVEILLADPNLKADPSLKNSQGLTAYDLAKNDEVAVLLVGNFGNDLAADEHNDEDDD